MTEENQNFNLVNKEPSATESIGLFLWDLVKIFLISMVIIIPIRYFIAQPFIVSGSSMEPNFHSGEYLIISELSYRIGEPQRGDIVVFKYPKDTTQYFIKRIIGLPGETVKLDNQKVTVMNSEHPEGFVLDETYLPAGTNTYTYGNSETTTLGSREYYVLGDNRAASSDSRFWGPVPKNDLIGKVFVRAYPFQSFTKFDSVQY
jgi:signal peptidase I